MLCKVINSKCLNGLLRLLDEGSFADLLAAGLLNGVVVDLCLLFTICKSNDVFVSSKDILKKRFLQTNHCIFSNLQQMLAHITITDTSIHISQLIKFISKIGCSG